MDQTVTIRRLLQASREEVFDAWLDPEGMQEWMRPGSVTHCQVTLDPQVGGEFCILMQAPGAQFVSRGRYRILERPSKLSFTWISSRWDDQETLVTIELHQQGAHCELVLTHERFPRQHSAPQLIQGWNGILEKLQAAMSAQAGDPLR